MFALKRLLERAGKLWWHGGRRFRGRWPVAALPPRRSVALRLEALEPRIVPTLWGQQIFPLDNPWNQNIANAPVASNSAAVISNIGSSIHLHPDWGEDSTANGNSPLYGIPVNVVHGNSAAKVHVIIDNYPDESDLLDVPMPTNPVIEGDFQNGPNNAGGGYNTGQRGDSHFIVWDMDNNIAYELYGVTRPADPTLFPDTNGVEKTHTDASWHAAGETVWDMKTNNFRTLGFTSADAAGLSILAGLARPDEGLPVADGGQGAINHALRFTLPSSKIEDLYEYPASHKVTNNSAATNRLPMGAHLRLRNDATVNNLISTMGPEAQIIAHAMQQYGLILADIGSSMYITGSSATHNASNQVQFVWNMNDVLDLNALTAGNFDVVDLKPRVTGLSQTTAGAGNTITVIGQNFSGAAGHLTVFFGSTAGTNVTFIDDSHLSVTVPNGTGTVQVTVLSGISAPGNPDNASNPIFGYGQSTTSASFTFGQPAASTTTTASNASAAFSNIAQSFTLSATVTSSGAPVDGGTVTFTVFSGATQIGLPATSGTVSAGAATANYSLPGNTPSGSYTIKAVYTPSSGTLAGSSDNTHALSITSGTTFATTTSATSTSTNGSTATLSAVVTSGGSGVNEGTVTFELLDSGNNVIGTPVTSANVSGGNASVTYALPAGASGIYTIRATYNPGTDYGGSVDTSHTLAVNRPPAFTSAATTTFSTGGSNTFTVMVSGFPTAALSHGAGMPAGVTFANNGNGTATLSGIPTGAVGTYAFNITASNSVGTATQAFTLTVVAPPAQPLFTDNFNRANAANLGASWTTNSGGFQVQNNLAVSTPGVFSVATVAGVAQANVSVQANVDLSGVSTGHADLVARYSGPGDTNMYVAMLSKASASSFSARIYRNIGGTWTLLKSATVGTGTGLLRFDVMGNSLRLYVNGSLLASATDTAISGAGSVGVRGLNGVFDNFTVTALPPVYTDSFTQANGSALSGSWKVNAGGFQVQNNLAVSTPSTFSNATLLGVSQANVSVQANVDLSGVATGHADLVARYSGPGDTNMYAALLSKAGTNSFSVLIYRNLGGTWTLLKSATVGTGTGLLRFDVMGSSLRLYLNGMLAASATDTAIATAGSVGIRGLNAAFDNFSATTIPPVFTDAFTQAAGTALSGSWKIDAGGFQVQNNRAVSTPGVYSVATLPGVSEANVTVQANVDVSGVATGHADLVARYSGPGDTNMYVAMLSKDSATTFNTRIYRNVGGTWTLLKSATVGTGTGLLRFDVVGSSLRLYLNGALVASATDTAITAAGSVGIRGINAAFDDFSANPM